MFNKRFKKSLSFLMAVAMLSGNVNPSFSAFADNKDISAESSTYDDSITASSSVVASSSNIQSEIVKLADQILCKKPSQGYLTISNALQWRLQYKWVIELNNTIDGVVNYAW